MRTLTVLLLATLGCAPAPEPEPEPGDGGASAPGDGFHRVGVEQAHGTEDAWIYAASPSGKGPFPVVVYAHGQGASNLFNCTSQGPPNHADVASSTEVADALASLGYVGVAVFYRHIGDVAPVAGEFKFRDHNTLDVRTLLAAAQWAKSQHGKGSANVAFAGTSMGTYPAFLAGTSRPQWASLQEGLDIRLVVIAGMFLNHLSNLRQNFRDLDGASDEATTQRAILGAALFVPPIIAGIEERPSITTADLASGTAFRERLSAHLSPAAIDLFRDLLITPGSSLGLPECESFSLRAACDPQCANAAATRAFASGPSPIDRTDWLSPGVLDLVQFWDPLTGSDPAAQPAGSPIALVRDISPVFKNHEMEVPRVLPLLSARDHTFEFQGQPAADLLADFLVRLELTQLSEVPQIDSDSVGACGHSDYFLPSRPDCGWRAMDEALRDAFAN